MDGPKNPGNAEKFPAPGRSSASHRKPRFLVIGAGRRGTAYASAVQREGLPAIIAAVAEPIRSTRISFGKKNVWGEDGQPREGQSFEYWQQFLDFERKRREGEAAGKKVYPGIDGIIICTQDHSHKEICALEIAHPVREADCNVSARLTESQRQLEPPPTAFSCPHERNCDWSAKKLYVEKLYDKGERDWPIFVVVPDIEDIAATSGTDHGRAVLTELLSADYDSSTPQSTVESKQWYGRCVWECDNDVLDDQIVTLTWDDDSRSTISGGKDEFPDRGPKTAVFHMAAFTEAQSKRRGKISGTRGEIQYDSNEIRVYTFDKFRDPDAVKVFTPPKTGGGHGGGDGGLMNQFSRAVEAVINGKLSVEQAQAEYVGCTLKEAFMSHAMVFAAEEARIGRKVVDWREWWARVEEGIRKEGSGSD